MSVVLRPYQAAAVERLRASFRAGRRAPLLVSPTGSGKTVIFSHLAAGAARRGRRVLVLVHRRELLAQTSRALDLYGVDHDILGGMLGVRVATVQAYARRLSKWSWEPDLVIIDEAHHCTDGSSWGQVLSAYPRAWRIGCTATPERLDGSGLGAFFDDLVLGPAVSELVEAGFLSRPVVFAPPGAADLSEVKTRAGDWAAGALEAVVDKPAIIGDAVEHYARLGGGAPAIAFGVSIAHAEHIAERFRAGGWNAASIDGRLDDASRRERIEDLGAGRLNVLTSCELISEGTDVPVVGAAILLRPTLSLGLYLQQVGRALRVYPGKQRAVILDHVGNSSRHGLPDEPRVWSLDGRKRKRADPDAFPVRQCEQCYFVHPPAPRCPNCGFLYPIISRDLPEERPGELVEQSGGAHRALRQADCRGYAELVAFARSRGYRNPAAWAHFVNESRRHKRRGPRRCECGAEVDGLTEEGGAFCTTCGSLAASF